jgi:hypothetical protein
MNTQFNVAGRTLSDSEDSSSEEDIEAEAQLLVTEAEGIQQILRERHQQVQEMNQPTIAALGGMNYLQGVNLTLQNLTTSSSEVTEYQRSLSSTLAKGEQAIADRQRELNGLQIQAQSLRKKLHKHKCSNPAVDFALDFVRMAVSNKQ